MIWPLNAQHALSDDRENKATQCYACGTLHRTGYCPLKLAGEEYCNLCGLAHYGRSRTCPHLRSETQVRDMLATLKQSTESRYLVDMAVEYLTGVKGHLIYDKKKRSEKQTERDGLQQVTGNTTLEITQLDSPIHQRR